jgi:hypothetical protein
MGVFSPLSVSGCQLWLDAADGTAYALTLGHLSQWNDKSGNANHVVQAVDANRPTTTTLFGQNSFAFNGTSQYLDKATSTGLPIGSNASTVFVVSSTNATSGNVYSHILSWGSNSPNLSTYLYQSADTPMHGMAWASGNGTSNFSVASQIALDVNAHVLSFVYAGGAVASTPNPVLEVDGSAPTIGSTAGTPAVSGSEITIGAGISGGFAWWNGTIAEVLIYSSALSVANRQLIEGYLAWKWGLQANLPAGHPYKSGPPGGLGVYSAFDTQAAKRTTDQWMAASGVSLTGPFPQPVYPPFEDRSERARRHDRWEFVSGALSVSGPSPKSVFVLQQLDADVRGRYNAAGWAFSSGRLDIGPAPQARSTSFELVSVDIRRRYNSEGWAYALQMGIKGPTPYFVPEPIGDKFEKGRYNSEGWLFATGSSILGPTAFPTTFTLEASDPKRRVNTEAWAFATGAVIVGPSGQPLAIVLDPFVRGRYNADVWIFNSGAVTKGPSPVFVPQFPELWLKGRYNAEGWFTVSGVRVLGPNGQPLAIVLDPYVKGRYHDIGLIEFLQQKTAGTQTIGIGVSDTADTLGDTVRVTLPGGQSFPTIIPFFRQF